MVKKAALKKRVKKPVGKKEGKSEIGVKYMSLSEIKRWPRNPKDHDIGALSQSMDRFGYVMPMLRDEQSGQLLAGHGRLDTLLALQHDGGEAPERVKVGEDGEWLVPVITGIKFAGGEREAQAYVIADNRHVEIGGWDKGVLADMLKDMTEDSEDRDFMLSSMGWDLADYGDLLDEVNPQFDVATFEEQGKLDQRKEKLVKCPHCGEEFSV